MCTSGVLLSGMYAQSNRIRRHALSIPDRTTRVRSGLFKKKVKPYASLPGYLSLWDAYSDAAAVSGSNPGPGRSFRYTRSFCRRGALSFVAIRVNLGESC